MSNLHLNQPIVFDGYAILSGNGIHQVWDISNPYMPIQVNEIKSLYFEGEAESHQITLSRDENGNYFMATISGKGFDIWNITNIKNPIYVATYEVPNVNYGDVDNGVWGLSWQGNYLYVGATNQGVFVVDVSNKNFPSVVSQVSLTQLGGVKAGPLFAIGDLLVVTSPKESTGIATIDIRDPENPVALDYVKTADNNSYIGGFYGKNAVIINPVRFYDVTTDPSNIQLVGIHKTPQAEYLSFDEGQLFLGGLRGGTEGIHIYDIKDLNGIQMTGYIPGRDSRWDDQFSCPVGNMVIVADDQLVDGKYVGAVLAVHKQEKNIQGPSVICTIPAHNATGVSVNSSIGISLSDWIEFTSVNESSIMIKPSGGGNPVKGTWTWLYTTLNFTPAEPLLINTEYSVTLGGNITDLVGNPMSSGYQFTFTTGVNGPSNYNSPDISGNEPSKPFKKVTWNINNPSSNVIYKWSVNGELKEEGTQFSSVFNEIGRYRGCLKVYEKNSSELIYEAESGSFSTNGGGFSNNLPGFTGKGYMDFSENQGEAIYLEWRILSPFPMVADINFRYANGESSDLPLNLVINGQVQGKITFPSTGGWDSYSKQILEGLFLQKGFNTFRLVANAGSKGSNIDHLKLYAKESLFYEAEEGQFSSGAGNMSSEKSGYTGIGYMDFSGNQGDEVFLEWSIKSVSEIKTDLHIAYANGGLRDRPLSLIVNGEYISKLSFPPSGSWGTYSSQTFKNIHLLKGVNSIQLVANNGSDGPNVDHIFLPIVSRIISTTEAEESQINGGIAFVTAHRAQGSGYAIYPPKEGPEVNLSWKVSTTDSTGQLIIRYANGGPTTRKLTLRINNQAPTIISFPSTGSWKNWHTTTTELLDLQIGSNQFSLAADAGTIGPNLDKMMLSTTEADLTGRLLESKCFIQVVYENTEKLPKTSTTIVNHNHKIWNVNSDAGTVSAINAENYVKLHEVNVGKNPKSIALVDQDLWVLNQDSWNISVINSDNGNIKATYTLPFASQPNSIVISHDNSYALISLQAIGEIQKISTSTGKLIGNVAFRGNLETPQLGAMALDSEGDKLLVVQFISQDQEGHIFEINPITMRLTKTIRLSSSKTQDASNNSRGIPNYLKGITINPNGMEAWVASKKDNIERGLFRDNNFLDHQTTVRAVTSRIEMSSMTDQLSKRIDFDNSDRCSSVTFNALGDIAFITLPGNNKVAVTDTWTGSKITEFITGKVPDASVFDTNTNKLFVHNILSRSITVIDVTNVLDGTGPEEYLAEVSVVAKEPFSSEVLLGKQIFYDATSKKLNQSGYMSCASCHLDGGHDGRTWDFTSLNEGLRNTIDLRGKAGTKHGLLHWTANFDEIHDFENQIRGLGAGQGLMPDNQFVKVENPLGITKAGYSEDLDALSAYVSSLDESPRSPFRKSNGSLTSDGELGRIIFLQNNCQTCHSGTEFTDSPSRVLHDIGTIKAGSGKRIGKTLEGFDTPSLKGIWNSAPYLHDGSASTLQEAILAHEKINLIGDVNLLAEYLKQIDENENNLKTSKNIISVQSQVDKPKIMHIYPIPTNDFLNIQGNLELAKIQLFTLDGCEIFQEEFTGSLLKISVQGLSKGIYILNIINNNVQHKEKILIE